jgi:oligogalacturonide lyase
MTTLPPEFRPFTDPRTGARVRQVTDHPSIHHHPFYYLPCMDDAMTRLFFVSHRTGRPEIWCEIRATGELQQLTDQSEIGEWSVHPSHDGRFVYYTAGQGAWRVATDTGKAERLVGFGGLAGREAGMVGAAMGTTTLSHDDRYWAVPVKIGARFRFIVIDTRTGRHETILEADTIGHPEFHPSDNTLLRYAGSYKQRIWVINRDGSGNRLVYDRQPLAKPGQCEWIVHETWNPRAAKGTLGVACRVSDVSAATAVRDTQHATRNTRHTTGDTRHATRNTRHTTGDTRHPTREIITANWPHGCIGIDIDTGAVRPVCSFNAWHPSINRQGTLMCTDTTFPDIGLQLFDPRDGVGQPRTLCFPGATNEGKHWDTDHCPYDDEDYKQGKWKVYAPQHTHPHPSFSPDGRFVIFTSDRTGHSQVYEVEVEVRRD